MEMKINANKVISERKARAWSQQHLAEVSDVSLRTIQRVENNGTGSLETVKALASCFELDVNMLFTLEIEAANRHSNSKSRIAVICSLVIALLSSVFFIVPASVAKDITITAEDIETNNNEGYVTYSKNVEIFFSKDIPYEVLVDSKWESNSSSINSRSVKIYLESSIIFIEKAFITKVDNGTKITADYAKSSSS